MMTSLNDLFNFKCCRPQDPQSFRSQVQRHQRSSDKAVASHELSILFSTWNLVDATCFVQAFSSATTVSSRMQPLMSKGQPWALLKRTRAPEQKLEACYWIEWSCCHDRCPGFCFELGSFLSTVRRSTDPCFELGAVSVW
jgi:hypothetical protein